MKISEQWLRELVNPAIGTKQLAEQLTMAGMEVEAIDKFSIKFTGVIVARVKSVAKHPNSEKLHLCKVDAGKGKMLDIVCGAENVRPDMHVALATDGASLPGNRKVKTTEIRGIFSNGMLCSTTELGLSDEAEGIWELPANLKPGQDLARLLKPEDYILDISLTPNRGDCLSIKGIAREVAVINNCKLKNPAIKKTGSSQKFQRKIVLDENKACPHYAGKIIKNIDNTGVVPLWLSQRLQRCGIRSINPVVDITNYVMLELGQPMHAFDNNNLDGAIHVRHAKKGEKLVLLDQQTIDLDKNVLVIADEKRVLAMAGIMGGLHSAVTDNSTTVFLESAYFDSRVISGVARKYGLHTDSSHRFERGVDFTLQVPAIERASQLIIEICGGIAGPAKEASAAKYYPARKPIKLHDYEIERLLGIPLQPGTVTKILKSLGMKVVHRKKFLEVTPPSYRFDISLAADLIEELARIYGYENIPEQQLHSSLGFHNSQRDYDHVQNMRSLLVHRGYQEAITYSFVDKKLQELLAPTGIDIELENPIASDLSVMRTSIWPGLINALLYNLNRQQTRVRMFETGLIYQKLQGKIRQEPVIGGLVYGNIYDKQWDKGNIPSNYYDIKSDVEELLAMNGNPLKVIDFRPVIHPALQPGQSAEIFIKNQKVGVLGTLHPGVQMTLGLPQQLFLFELYIRVFSKQITAKFQKISKFPMVKRDLAIVVDAGITVAQIMRCIQKGAPDTLINLELFDVYRGEGIDLGKKSLALGLTFQGSSSTLTDEDVESTLGGILSRLKSELGGTLRE